MNYPECECPGCEALKKAHARALQELARAKRDALRSQAVEEEKLDTLFIGWGVALVLLVLIIVATIGGTR